MTERKVKIGKVQITFGQSSKLLKLVVMVLILVSSAALIALGWAEYDIKKQTASMAEQAAQVEYENGILQRNIDELGSIKSVERIAQEELGMVSPDTVLIEAQVR